MHRGRIIHERYLAGGSASKAMMLVSGSKSFVGVGALTAAADGLLRLDHPVSELLPEWKRDARKSRVTVRQLLLLESGIERGAAMNARDWATFGEMIRRGGLQGSTRILPADLVAQLLRPSSVNPAYGMPWWLRDAAFQTNPAMGAPGIGDDDGAPGAPTASGRGRILERLKQRAAARRHGGAGKQRL